MPDDRKRTYSDEAIVNVETSHEKSDVDVKALLWFVVIFTVFAVVTHVFLYLLFRFYVRMERKPNQNAPALTAMQRPANVAVPAEPRLQPFPSKEKDGSVMPPNASTPVTDMERMLGDSKAVLNSYGWVDPQKGIVHIPIEEAKKRILGQLNAATGFSPSQSGLKPAPTSGQPGAQP